MYDILDGLASDQDAVSNVFFGTVRERPDLHSIFLEHNSREIKMEELLHLEEI